MKRRDALKIFGGILGGGLLLTSSNWLADSLNASQPNKLPQLPWIYKSIDPKKAAERAYFGFYKGGCCYGAFDAIVGTLQDEVGFPFTGIPTELFVFGRGGIAEVGSTLWSFTRSCYCNFPSYRWDGQGKAGESL